MASQTIISNGEDAVLDTLDVQYGGVQKRRALLSGATATLGDMTIYDAAGTAVVSLPAAANSALTLGTKMAATATANTIADPGNAGAIPVTASGVCMLTSAGAETRTIARPTFVGQEISLICDTYVGNIVVTAAAAINQTGNTIMTFGAAADMIKLTAMKVAGLFVWRVTANDGTALS